MNWPLSYEVTVRYRDLDTYGHVNNVVYGTYCEEARSTWIVETLDVADMDEFSGVLASLSMDFRQPVTRRTTLAVDGRVTEIGESSFALAYRIRDGSDVVAEAESTQVHIDEHSGRSRPLPDEWRSSLEEVTGTTS